MEIVLVVIQAGEHARVSEGFDLGDQLDVALPGVCDKIADFLRSPGVLVHQGGIVLVIERGCLVVGEMAKDGVDLVARGKVDHAAIVVQVFILAGGVDHDHAQGDVGPVGHTAEGDHLSFAELIEGLDGMKHGLGRWGSKQNAGLADLDCIALPQDFLAIVRLEFRHFRLPLVQGDRRSSILRDLYMRFAKKFLQCLRLVLKFFGYRKRDRVEAEFRAFQIKVLGRGNRDGSINRKSEEAEKEGEKEVARG